MTAVPVLQCARVDNLPNHTGRANLSDVLEGTTTAACSRCRAQVWVSRPARILVTVARGYRPVCDVCEPALPISLDHLHDGDT